MDFAISITVGFPIVIEKSSDFFQNALKRFLMVRSSSKFISESFGYNLKTCPEQISRKIDFVYRNVGFCYKLLYNVINCYKSLKFITIYNTITINIFFAIFEKKYLDER